MNRMTTLLLMLLLCSASVVAPATDATPAKPSAQAAKAAKAAKPSARGPGTQTEDELYIGAKARTPQKARAKPAARGRTGDEDLEDLEVQRNRSKAR